MFARIYRAMFFNRGGTAVSIKDWLRIVLLGSCLISLSGSQASAAGGPSAWTGTLIVEHLDDFDAESSEDRLTLRGRDGRDWRVEATNDARPLLGRLVRVVGSGDGTTLRGRVEPLDDSAATSARIGAGPRRVAVVIVTLSDAPAAPTTQAQARQSFFEAEQSAARFFGQQSAGRVTLAGETFAPLALSVSGVGCDYDAFKREVFNRLGSSLDGFDHVAIVHPNLRDCTYGGLGDVAGPISWYNGGPDVSVITHELGHNMGAHHASTLACAQAGAPVSLAGSSSCSVDEYGDPFDTMALGSSLMSTWHRLQTDNISAGDDAYVRASQTIRLAPTTSTSGVRSIRVPRRVSGQATQDFFALELRRASAPFDAFGSSQPVVQGVSVRLVQAIERRQQSALLDMTPGSPGGFGDAALLSGASFLDPVSGTELRVGAIDAGGATVSIVVPRPDATPPEAPRLRSSATSATTVDFSWFAASDDEELSHYEIERDGAVVAQTTTQAFAETGPADGRAHGYRAVAVDVAGNRSLGGAVVQFQAPQPAPAPQTAQPPQALAPRPASSSAQLPARSSGGAKFPAKLKVKRASVKGGRLDVLFSITGRATGKLTIDYQAAGRFERYTVDVGTAREGEKPVRLSARLHARQRGRSSGILNVSYAGNGATLSDELRLRAAHGRTLLVRDRLTFSGGRLSVGGTVDRDVSGVVRLRATYRSAGGAAEVWTAKATIRDGRWSVDERLPSSAANDPDAYLTIQFTGDLRARGGPYRGEQDGKSIGNLG